MTEKEGLTIMEEFKIAVNLTKNYRQSKNTNMTDTQKRQIEFLTKIWEMSVDVDDFNFIKSRFETNIKDTNAFKDCQKIALENEIVNQINLEELDKIDGDYVHIGGKTQPECYTDLHYGKVRGVNGNLVIKIGCKIMLTSNVMKSVKLNNGATGTVHDII